MVLLRCLRVANKESKSQSPPPSERRRSLRLAKTNIVVQIHSSKGTNGKRASRKMSQPVPAESEQRRNPKRKAAAPPQSHTVPDSLLAEALKPLSSEEIEEWDGWIELESEPAFFNIILRNLGVKDVKVQELFTLDQESLDILPKPVFGLIFLFQYSPFLDDGDAAEEDGSVWFANQVSSNACATVALLNIVMNHTAIDLGSELTAFKEATVNKSTPVRGYELGKNLFIRKTHNSFARRMDCLNADLLLENESSDAKSRKRISTSRSTSHRKRAKKRSNNEYGYHFVAYVPSGGFVWELDGLRGKPRKLGTCDEKSWTKVALPQIKERMLQYEESQLSFNLLSICQSPLQQYRNSLVTAMSAILFLDEQMQTRHGPSFVNLVSEGNAELNIHDVQLLAEFSLKGEDIDSALAPDSLKVKVDGSNLTLSEAVTLRYELEIEARALMGEYRGEMMAASVDEERAAVRKKDYGSMLHQWISKLAEKGALEDVIRLSN